MPGTRSRLVYALAAMCEMSSSTASTSQNQSKPVRPTACVHMKTYISVVNGRKMIPSSGHSQLPSNGARNWFGRAIQRMMSATRGNAPAKTANRQPISHPLDVDSVQLAATLVGGIGRAPCYDAHPDRTGRRRQQQNVRPVGAAPV